MISSLGVLGMVFPKVKLQNFVKIRHYYALRQERVKGNLSLTKSSKPLSKLIQLLSLKYADFEVIFCSI